MKFYLRSKSTGQYYNIEEFTYLVKCSKEDAKPNSKAMARSFADCDEDLEMVVA